MKKKLFLLFIVLFSFCTNVSATTSVYDLITVGTGNYQIKITNKTTIKEIEAVLGTAKLKTSSPFGGYAYTFYTDSNYSNHLYIETNEDDAIILYGSVSPNYVTGNSYSEYGVVRYDNINAFTAKLNGKNVGTVLPNYYRYGKDNYSFADIAKKMQEGYSKDPIAYQKGMFKHAYIMLDAILKNESVGKKLLFSDELLELQTKTYKDNYSLVDILYKTNEYNGYSFPLLKEYNTLSSLLINFYRNDRILNPLVLVDRALLAVNDIKNNYYVIFEFKYYNDDDNRGVSVVQVNDNVKNMLLSGEISKYLAMSEDDILASKKVFQSYTMNRGAISDYDRVSAVTQYAQNGTWYNLAEKNQTMSELFKTNHGVCSAYADATSRLANNLGTNCYYISGRQANHAMAVCYINHEWSYIDATKIGNDNTPFLLSMLSVDSFHDQKGINMNSFFKVTQVDGFTFQEAPQGTDREDKYTRNIYFDDTYKYYIKIYDKKEDSACKQVECGYVVRENLKSGQIDKLSDIQHQASRLTTFIELIVDGNDIFYVGEDKKLYQMTKDGKNIQTKVNGNVNSMYMQNGVIYYVIDGNGKKLKDAVSWPTIGEYKVNNNYKYIYAKNDIGVTIVNAVSTNGLLLDSNTIEIPDMIDSLPVIGISRKAFNNFEGNIDTLKLPKYLEYIDDLAFYSVNIKKIIFNDKLKSIGDSAFAFNNTLESIDIPDNVIFLNQEAFSYNSNLKNVKIGKGVKVLNDYVVTSNELKTFELSNGLEVISKNAFPVNTKMSEIIIPSTVTYLDLTITPNKILWNQVNNPNLDRIIINAKNLTYLDISDITNNYDNVKIFLHGNSKTGTLAKNQNINFIDLDNLNQKLTLSKTNLSVSYFDEQVKLTYQLEPVYFNDVTATWTSSNPSVVSVDKNGLLKYNDSGEAIITLSLSNGLKATCNVTVKPSKSSNILIDKPYLKLSVGEKYTYKPLILLADGETSNNITWSSSNTSIASVDSNGCVTALKNGEVDITLKSNGMTKIAHVTVQDEYLVDTISTSEYVKYPVVIIPAYNALTNKNNEVYVNYNNSNTSLININTFNANKDQGGFAILTATDKDYGNIRKLIYVLGPVETPNNSNSMFGDLNNDYVLDINDLKKLANLVKDNTYYEEHLDLADFDNNNVLDSNDLDLMYELIASDFKPTPSDITIEGGDQTLYLNDFVPIYNYIFRTDKATALAKWEVDNEKVLKLSGNTGEYVYVNALALGTAKLTVTAYDGAKKTVTITVKEPTYELSTDNIILEQGSQETVSLITKAASISTTYRVSDDKIAVVGETRTENTEIINGKYKTTSISSDYTIEGKELGTSYLIITSKTGKEFKVHVSVIAKSDKVKNIEKVTISGNNTMNVGTETKLSATITPNDTTDDKSLTWTSSNELIATVNEDGIVSALSDGDVIISATSSNGIKQNHKITINAIPIESITLSKNTLSLPANSTEELLVTINPNNTTIDQMINWSSSNEEVATVKNGKITALKQGTATIVAKTVDGKETKCNVTVTEAKYKKGDLNKNGKIDLPDVILALKKYLGIDDITSEDMLIGDMDNDSKIRLNDIILLLRVYLGLD